MMRARLLYAVGCYHIDLNVGLNAMLAREMLHKLGGLAAVW